MMVKYKKTTSFISELAVNVPAYFCIALIALSQRAIGQTEEQRGAKKANESDERSQKRFKMRKNAAAHNYGEKNFLFRCERGDGVVSGKMRPGKIKCGSW